MPLLPGLCDSRLNLEAVVRATAEHGGQFVLASSLTLADQQRDFFFQVLNERFHDLLEPYQRLYPPGSYAPADYDWRSVALTIRELCTKYSIRDRQPRPIIPGDRRTRNRKIVEILAEQVYTLELENAPAQKVWAYRKAAWAIEDLEQDIGLVEQRMGLKGLQSIPDIGPSLAGEIQKLLKDEKMMG
jgi:hypothetical protein